MPAYTTDIYPYPAAMWDEAAAHLADHRGWVTILLAPPATVAEACATAKEEMSNRGVANTTCLIASEVFSDTWYIRISRLEHIDPRWDDVEHHLNNHADAALVVIDTGTTDLDATAEEARAAMAERGLNVGIGVTTDPSSVTALLRVFRDPVG